MFTYRKFLLSPVLIVALLLGTAPMTVISQDDSERAIAILVVDVFDTAPLLVDEELLRGDEYCAVSPDGQDSFVIEGGSDLIDLTGVSWKYGLTPALHPGLLPHGELVYTELEHLLSIYSGSLLHETTGDTEFGTGHEWIPNIALYEVSTVPGFNGKIVLMAIDTNQYEINAINQRVSDVIALLSNQQASGALANLETQGIVVNMSFALIPCNQYPHMTIDDYIAVLAEFSGEALNLIDPDCEDYDLAEKDVSAYDEQGLVRWLDIQRAFECELILREDPYDFLQTEIFQPLRSAANWSRVLPRLKQTLKTMPAYGEGPTQAVEMPGTMVDANQSISALVTLIESYSADAVFVASAGNEPLSFPYYPALDPRVLSVSAEYADLNLARCSGIVRSDDINVIRTLLEQLVARGEIPPELVDEIIDALEQQPHSNAGEVQMNGVSAIHVDQLFGCLHGTSFAAPRMSLEQAIYMLSSGSIPCNPGTIAASNPPLAYGTWDNLPRIDAGDQYCGETNDDHNGFNDLVDPPVP